MRIVEEGEEDGVGEEGVPLEPERVRDVGGGGVVRVRAVAEDIQEQAVHDKFLVVDGDRVRGDGMEDKAEKQSF